MKTRFALWASVVVLGLTLSGCASPPAAPAPAPTPPPAGCPSMPSSTQPNPSGQRLTFYAALTSGSFAGTTFPVVFSYEFSYESAQVLPSGDIYIPLQSFDFTLRGVSFTRKDIFQGGQVILRNGALENVTASFQVFLPPNSPVTNITFGFGEPRGIGYTDLNNQYGEGFFTFCPG